MDRHRRKKKSIAEDHGCGEQIREGGREERELIQCRFGSCDDDDDDDGGGGWPVLSQVVLGCVEPGPGPEPQVSIVNRHSDIPDMISLDDLMFIGVFASIGAVEGDLPGGGKLEIGILDSIHTGFCSLR